MKKFFQLLFKNLPYKLGSLFIAVIIWGIVQGQEQLEIDRKMTVNIAVADGYLIRGESIRRKDVTISGPRVLVSDYASRPLEAYVRIPRGAVGNIRVRIGREYLRDWSDRIKLTVHDAYITVFVDEKSTRNMPVREVLQGTPSEGYFIEKVTINPPEVQVVGLKSEIKKTKEVVTETIDISGIKESRTVEVNLKGQGLTTHEFGVDTVSVMLQVGDSRVNRKFENVPVEIVGTDYLTSVRPKFVTIEIQGTPNVLKFVKTSDFRAFVEARGLSPGRHERAVQVKIPPETVLIETTPEKAILEVIDQKRVN